MESGGDRKGSSPNRDGDRKRSSPDRDYPGDTRTKADHYACISYFGWTALLRESLLMTPKRPCCITTLSF